MKNTSKLSFLINVLFYGTVALIVYLFIRFLFVYMLPFIIGTVITVAVQRPSTAISRKFSIKKGYCALSLVILIYLILIVIIALLMFKVGSYIYSAALSENFLFNNVRNFVDKISNGLNNFSLSIPKLLLEQLANISQNILQGIVNMLSEFAKSTVKAMPMFFTSSIVTIIASCYIAKDYDRFKYSVASVVSSKYKKAFLVVKSIFTENIYKVFLGYMKILLITFTELALGLFLLRVQNFLLYAILISLLDLLPILGTGTILLPWGIYSILTGNYFLGAGLMILYIIVMIVRSVVEPKIIGKQIGLHPLIALIAVFIGLKLFGFIGLFILPLIFVFIYKSFDMGVFEILFGDN